MNDSKIETGVVRPQEQEDERPGSPKGSGLATDALLLFTVFVWGVNFSVVKFALSEIPPLAFNTIRFLAASAVLAVAVYASGYRWRIQRRHLPWMIGLGLLGNSLYQILFVLGAAATTADNAALMLGTVPVWVALAGSLAGMERVAAGGWCGIALSLLGLVLIILGADRSAEFRFGGATFEGDALVLLATLCWAAYSLLVRFAMRHYRTMTVTSFCIIVGSLPMILAGLPQVIALRGQAISVGAWVAAIFSGVLAISLATFFWNVGISRLGSARTTLYSNLVPVFALVTAWLFLGETLTLRQGGGALLAVSGVLLARRYTRHAGA